MANVLRGAAILSRCVHRASSQGGCHDDLFAQQPAKCRHGLPEAGGRPEFTRRLSVTRVAGAMMIDPVGGSRRVADALDQIDHGPALHRHTPRGRHARLVGIGRIYVFFAHDGVHERHAKSRKQLFNGVHFRVGRTQYKQRLWHESFLLCPCCPASVLRVSILPFTAASVKTRVVSWKDAAEMNERVCRLALVMPSSTGTLVAGFLPSARAASLAVSKSSLSTCSLAKKSVSPGSTMSTFCSICRTITSMCLSLMLTPWSR